MAELEDQNSPLVAVCDRPRQLEGEGATIVFVATLDQPELALLTLVCFSLMALSIHAAWISATVEGSSFATYIVLDEEAGYMGRDKRRFEAITRELTASFEAKTHAQQIAEAVRTTVFPGSGKRARIHARETGRGQLRCDP